MLVLSRKAREAILIGDNVWVTVLEVRGGTVRLGVEAPREISVMRAELLEDSQAKVEASEAA